MRKPTPFCIWAVARFEISRHLGGTFGTGTAINAAAQVAGDSTTAGETERHAFLYRNGVTRDLGTFGGMYSTASALNDAGQVVGHATTASGERHAYVLAADQLVDLNTAIPANSGWVLNYATALNDSGQIAGEGTIGGERHVFLLTAIPAATLELDDVQARYGESPRLTARLTVDGVPLAHKTVSFSIGGVNAGSAATGDDGVAHVDVNADARVVGPYPMTAVFGGDEGAGAATDGATLTVIKAVPTVTWTPTGFTFGTPLGDDQLNATPSVPADPIYSPDRGAILNAGRPSLHVSFIPRDSDNYEIAEASRDIYVLRAATSTALASSRSTALTTQQTVFTATVTSAAIGNTGGEVQFSDGGTVFGTAPVVCQNAVCTAVLSAQFAQGPHTIAARFLGSDNYLDSPSNPVSLTVGVVQLLAKPASAPFAGTTTLSATLMANGLPVAGQSILFTLNGEDVDSAVTGPNGVATLAAVGVGALSVGAHPNVIRVSFAGNLDLPGAASSADLAITPGKAGRLARVLTFTSQPRNVGVQEPIVPPVQVTARDMTGASVPGMAVKLSVLQGPSGSTLMGTTTRITSANGTVTFDDLKLNKLGQYVLGAASSGIGPFASKSFNVVRALASASACASPTFAGPFLIPGVDTTGGGAIADFNGDSLPDLAFVDESSNEIAIFLGGQFELDPIRIPLPGVQSPGAIGTADLNNDGRPDLVVTNNVQDGGIITLLEDGTGGFPTLTPFALPGAVPTALRLADVNRDGRIDAIVGSSAAPFGFWIMLGNPSGGFSPGTSFPTAVRTTDLLTGDFNEDGKVDVAVADDSAAGPSSVEIRLGTGTGGVGAFGPAILMTVGAQARLSLVGDMNGDGHADLGLLDGQPAHFSLLYGDGTGHFDAPVEIVPASSMPGSVVSGDVNGDGRRDLVVLPSSGESLHLLLNDGLGGFTASGDLPSPPGQLIVSDLTGDGKLDLLITSPDVMVLLTNNCGIGAPTDLELTIPPPVIQGSTVSITVNAVNRSLTAGTGVHLTLLGSNLSIQGFTASQGQCLNFGDALLCELGPIGPGGVATIVIDAVADAAGTLTANGTLAGAEGDPNWANNTATASVVVMPPAQTLYVRNTNDSGPESLRAAIDQANNLPDVPVTIAFDIPGGGVRTINLLNALPPVTSPHVTIDATTQTGFSGTPLIQLNGAPLGPSGVGLMLWGGGTVVRGLVVNRFGSVGIQVNSSDNALFGNFVGTNPAGTAALPNGFGMTVVGMHNRIGGPGVGEGNLLAGNQQNGIGLFAGGMPSGENLIQGNFIGTDVTGHLKLPNKNFGVGLSSPNNVVGGTGAGEGNVISGNQNEGISVFREGNRIQGNLIGTDASGLNPLGNGNGFNGGVSVFGSDTLIGGTVPGARNVISANDGSSINVNLPATSVGRTLIQGNFIGVDANGNGALGNKFSLNANGPNTTIGGDNVAARNIIAATTQGPGISANGTQSAGLVIRNNYIGTDVTGAFDRGNRNDGVQIGGVPGVTIDRNVISGNGDQGTDAFANGISVNQGSTGVKITRNLIGVAVSGDVALGNVGNGVSLNGGQETFVGGASVQDGNVISGNASMGVWMSGDTAGNVVAGNLIGTDSGGTFAISNGNGGVGLNGSSQNTIGLAVSRNVISGHVNSSAINISVEFIPPPSTAIPRVPTGNRVIGNRIGTTANGLLALGNGSNGVWVQGDSNTIGGAAPGEGNVIAASRWSGIYLRGNNNVVAGNLIGTNATGQLALPNNGAVFIDGQSSGNMIGGFADGARNVMSGNIGTALNIQSQANGNDVIGNFIGTDVYGASALSNEGGISIWSANNQVRNNLISANFGNAVNVSGPTATGNVIAGNKIGVTRDGLSALGNASSGIAINANGNIVGGVSDLDRNVIAASLFSGIDLRGNNNVVSGNFIGLNGDGTAALGNHGGVYVGDFSVGNTIGGSTAGERNVISGNFNSGVSVATTADNTKIVGNYIGTNKTGTAALGNSGGVNVSSSNNRIEGNLVSANWGPGIVFSASFNGPVPRFNRVISNLIGTTADGESALGNTGPGVILDGSENTLGGLLPGERNVIAASGASGVEVRGVQNLVQGNYIGTDKAGTKAVANQGGVAINDNRATGNVIGGSLDAGNVISGNIGTGINLNANGNRVSNNYIGTDATGFHALGNDTGMNINGVDNRVEMNVISGNRGDGVDLFNSGTVLRANQIGTDRSGMLPIGNKSAGVYVSGFNNRIGGPDAPDGNRIAHNQTGVLVSFGSGNAILSNLMDANAGAGIKLLFNSNNGQTAPVVGVITSDDVSTTIAGSLFSVPLRTYTVQLFGSPACHPSGSGEGATFLGQTIVTTDAVGFAAFTSPPVDLRAPGTVVTATATDSQNNTSMFSACRSVP